MMGTSLFTLFFVVFVIASTAVGKTDHVQTLQSKYKSTLPFHRNGKGCEYRGLWYPAGATVPTEEVCLRCRCVRGTLVCYLRVCPNLPDPPPVGCVIHLRNGNCCAELRCQDDEFEDGDDGIRNNELSRRDDEVGSELTVPYNGGCLHRGTLYASGSAMATSTDCEQCFCMGGAEKCVRPSCLPPPPGCKARTPPQGFCCPLHYDCEPISSTTLAPVQPKVCIVDGKWFPEGERVDVISASRCDNCFCLRGLIRCMPMACAPNFFGCKAIIRPGECCASGYDCSASTQTDFPRAAVTEKLSTSLNIENRSFHDRPTETATIINERMKQMRTVDPKNLKPERGELFKDDHDAVRISVNGTINCTSQEYSSQLKMESRTDDMNLTSIDRFDADHFDDYDSKTIITAQDLDNIMINVTSQLHTNKSEVQPLLKTANTNATNISMKNDDYSYDYEEATLPPSLPNLKIIPFVAADAVMNEGKNFTVKDDIDRHDKLPTYFSPTGGSSTNTNKYEPSVFSATITSSKDEIKRDAPRPKNSEHHYIVKTNEHENPFKIFHGTDDDGQDHKAKDEISKFSHNQKRYDVSEPEEDLHFTPPIITEGGFKPKDSEGFDHEEIEQTTILTLPSSTKRTSNGFQCINENGKIFENGSIMRKAADCSSCVCIFGEFRCHQPACPYLERGCIRVPSSTDPCCGIVICDNELTTVPPTSQPFHSLKDSVSQHDKIEGVTPEPSTKSIESSTHKNKQAETPLPPFKSLPSSNESFVDLLTSTSTPSVPYVENENDDYNIEEEEEDEDEGFSFGSVLKLLLSDYDTSTKRPKPAIYNFSRTSTEIPTTIYQRIHTVSEETKTSQTSTQKPTAANQNYHYTTTERLITKSPISITQKVTPSTQKTILSTKSPIAMIQRIPSTTKKTITSTQKVYKNTQPEHSMPKQPVSSSENPLFSLENPILSTQIAITSTQKPIISTIAPTKQPFTKKPYVNYGLNIAPERILYNSFLSNNIHAVTEMADVTESSVFTVTSKSLPTNKPKYNVERYNIKPQIIENPSTKRTVVEKTTQKHSVEKLEDNLVNKGTDIASQNSISSMLGVLKLAGCNIYGVMYKPGKLIEELSNKCLECMCTDIGVNCKSKC